MVKVFVVGRLTHDPELRTAANNATVCNFSVAVDTNLKDEAGEKIPNFYRATVWRGMADNCAKYLHKGDRVAVSGRLALRTYIGKDNVTRSQLEIDADDVEFLSNRGENAQPAAQTPAQPKAAAAPSPTTDDDIPF